MNTVINSMVHVSLLLCIGMIVVVARKCRRSQVRSAFLLTFGVMTVWSIGTILELDFRLATGVTNMLFVNICYIGICLVPVAVLYLGMVILHPDWHPQRRHAAFLIVPAVSIVVVFTDPLHQLFFVNFSLNSSEAIYGAYYYFHSFYSYGCIVAGVVLMLVASTRNSGLFSVQSLLVVSGVVITTAPNILYSFGAADLPFSISMAAFTVTILCFAVAFLKYRFITALPISLQQVVNLISDGYMVVDWHHCVLSYNRALLRLFPEPGCITPGMNLRIFIERYFIDTTYDQYLEMHARSAARLETVSTEARISGDIYVSVEITPVMQRGAQIGGIILLKDITQSKRLIEITKAESRYKSEFLSNMSHEIRTPMNAIIGMVNIGKAAADVDRKNYCLTRIEDASKHLLGIINDVLDISKIEAGKFELTPVEFIFEIMIQRMVNVVKFRADEKNQTLAVHIDEAIPRVLVGNDQRLAQVITNLAGNAIKFTPENGLITINAKLLEENGLCTIQIDVIDTGIGISPEQQARLFQPFVQAESDTSRKFGGTGLGLKISKSIVEKMGGKIWISSELGKGATFSFTVPMARGAEEKQGLFTQDEKSPTEEAGAGIDGIFKGRNILLAEDVAINREIVLALIEPTLVEIDCAENGAEAVAMFSKAPEKYEMIFMDVQMPEMDGYEATRRIRALELPNAKTIPIIAMTAGVFREDIEKCIESGMNGHVGKPLAIDDILQVLTRIFHGISPAGAQ